jgi:hypothetical protein
LDIYAVCLLALLLRGHLNLVLLYVFPGGVHEILTTPQVGILRQQQAMELEEDSETSRMVRGVNHSLAW